jgi:protein CpxP
MAKKLQLTTEQRQRAQQIFKNAKAEREKYQPMMQAFHQAMQSLLTASSFDEQAILALKENYKATFDQLALIKARSRFDLFAMLTPEQKDKWLAMQQRRKEF